MTIPHQRPDQSFADHQADMADWMGCSVDALNAAHDPLHRSMAAWLGLTSHAMRDAAGEALTPSEADLAAYEEQAVLYAQRYITKAGGTVP